MKAIRVDEFGDPSVLRVAEVATPQPGTGEVLVRIHAAGVNPVETYIRSGKYAKLPPLPYTPGNDGAGVVEALGAGVTGLAVGDRVYVAGAKTGTYAEQCVAAAGDVRALPAVATFAQGAALGVPYATSWRALMQRGGGRPGETVLINGATGGVGVAALQFARSAGLTVFATGGSEAGRVFLRAQGADEVFDHSDSGYRQAVLDRTSGRGVDLILEMLANVNLAHDLKLLAIHGRVVVIGNRGTIEIDPREAMAREADIRGVMLGHATPAEFAEAHEAIRRGLENRTLAPVIARELPLAEAPAAHEAVMASGPPGKIVLVP
ncbi:MAG TPA: NADPH:quinone reductase [Chthoniobacteraceae bacterium]|jgi:NADPH2:quinone reductase|nr:NADPH:quinone reductase [Chthoniobacteraceae bacterium]